MHPAKLIMFEAKPVFKREKTPIPQKQEVVSGDVLGQLKKQRLIAVMLCVIT